MQVVLVVHEPQIKISRGSARDNWRDATLVNCIDGRVVHVIKPVNYSFGI